MKTYGVGMIGMGFMGKTHTFAHTALPFYYPGLPFRTKLIGACNRSLPAAENAREELGFSYATTDPERIFSDPAIDLVHICAPNDAHAELLRGALRAGKHIYCDKPLTCRASDADEIAALAAEKGVVAQVAFQNRFFPATMRAAELVREGRIGEILCFRAVYLHAGNLDAGRTVTWKRDATSGALYDLGSHVLDLLYLLMGPFATVHCTKRVLYPTRPDRTGTPVEIQADDYVSLQLTLPSGAMGTVEATKIATGVDDELRFEIHGTRGALRFNLMHPGTLWFYDNTKPEAPLGGERGFTALECTARYPAPGNSFPSQKNVPGWIRAHIHSLYTFVTNVDQGRPACPSFVDGAYIQHVLETALQSAETGKTLEIPSGRI